MIIVFRAADTNALSSVTNLDYLAKDARAWTLATVKKKFV